MTPQIRSAAAVLLLSLPWAVAAHAADATEGFDWSGVQIRASADPRIRFGEATDAGGLDARRMAPPPAAERFGAIRARVGGAFERFVVYGAAGGAFTSAEFARAGNPAERVGWRVGEGSVPAQASSLAARADDLHIDIDRRDPNGGDRLDLSGAPVRLGLNARS